MDPPRTLQTMDTPSTLPPVRSISFEEIVTGRDSTVRVTDDCLIYAVDLVMAVTGQSRDHAGKTIRNISDEVFHSENFSERQLSTRGGAPTKLISFSHAIELVMVLPGKVAKEARVQFANVLRRYMAGDESLVSDIRANAASASPIAQLARASMTTPSSPQVIDEESLADRKRRREIEDVDMQHKRMSVASSFISCMNSLNPSWADDARLRVQTQDLLKNIALRPVGTPLLLEDGAAPQPATVTISDVAADMGRRLSHGQLCQVGKLVTAAYRRRHGGTAPPFSHRFVHGAERCVNVYTEADRDLISCAIEQV